jgi:hypothetical protein
MLTGRPEPVPAATSQSNAESETQIVVAHFESPIVTDDEPA